MKTTQPYPSLMVFHSRMAFHSRIAFQSWIAFASCSLALLAVPARGQLLQQQPPVLIQPNQPAGMLGQRPAPPVKIAGGCMAQDLKFTFRTGNDDLRGGNDNLDIEVHFADGTMQLASNVNKGNNWPNNSQNTVSVALKHPTMVTQIKGIKLIHGASGGITPSVGINAGGVPDPVLGTVQSIRTEDNWDLNDSQALAIVPHGAVPIASTGVYRFSGSKPSLDMTMSPNPGCADPGAVQKLHFVFRTGDDDLRGGSDNLNITIVGNGFNQQQDNVNQGQNWGNNSEHSVDISLNKQVTVDQLTQVQLYTTFHGGSGGDNWNMQSVQIFAISATASTPLVTQGFYRFTGPPGNQLRIQLNK